MEEPSNSFSLPGLQCPDCPLRNYPAHREPHQWDCQDTLPFPSRGTNPKPRQTPGRSVFTRVRQGGEHTAAPPLWESISETSTCSLDAGNSSGPRSLWLPPSPAPPPFFFLSSLALSSPPVCDSISAHQTLLNTNQPELVAFARESTNTPSLNVD